MTTPIEIQGKKIGHGHPVYLIAELSANHHQKFEEAVKLIEAAKEAGVDAVKLQTYTADTITIDSDRSDFRVSGGTLWDGRNLHSLYQEAYTPWEWQPKLQEIAGSLGLHLFSTAFDPTAVDFLENMGVPVHKIASFEITDIPLIEKAASTGKPLILSTGMASLGEIEEAVKTVKRTGNQKIVLLKCTSSYPAPYSSMNLRTIPNMEETFGTLVGLSDHSMGWEVPVAAVSLGICMVEKHFTLSRSSQGPDSAFSLEPHELKAMVQAVRRAEESLGHVNYGGTQEESSMRKFRKSLYVVKEMKAGEAFSLENVKSIRPGYGLSPRHLREILGKRASQDLERGTPLAWGMIETG